MPRTAFRHFLALACCLATGMALAADPAGVVKTVQGDVKVERSGKAEGVAAGSEVFSKDRVLTGANSSVGITLRDDTRLAAGSNSILDLNKYAFDPASRQGNFDATIKRGSLAVISGKLTKANPDAVRFHTPNTTLGVRGTEFVIDVGEDGARAQ